MDMNISILIPAYNAEKTIKRTLESLLKQTIQKFEVVIVNDGSSDGTQKILEEYQKKSTLLRVYIQENLGVSVTRQRLIEKASGTHFLFCDADDYFEPNAVEMVSNAINKSNADLLVFGYRLIRKGSSKAVLKRHLQGGVYTKGEWGFLHIQGLNDLYYSSLCNKCYKKQLIAKEPLLKFQSLIEDVTFNVEYMERCKSIHVLETVLYNCVQIGESMTRGKKVDSEQAIQEAFKAFGYLKKVLEKSYPNWSSYVNGYIYMMLNGLCDRAKKIGSKNIELAIYNSEIFCQCKKELGYQQYVFVARRWIGKVKGIIKGIVRR